MIETIIKAEYELDDMIDNIDDDTQYKSICIDLENDIDLLNKEIEELEEELKNKDKFFEPKTLQDEFKIQWIKDNWDKIPSI
jgi:ribosome-interacting GTPase 1